MNLMFRDAYSKSNTFHVLHSLLNLGMKCHTKMSNGFTMKLVQQRGKCICLTLAATGRVKSLEAYIFL